MKALLIGGTGTISMDITRLLSQMDEWEVTLLNRGNNRGLVPENVQILQGDIQEEDSVAKMLEGMTFDVVANFINFTPDQVARDIRLFQGKTKQYFFISSASAYQKPLSSYLITESTPLANPYWNYSRNKIACEDLLMNEYRENGFPVTIIRPSHTYSDWAIPVGLQGSKGSWQVVDRILKGKPIIVQGDGSSLWTMTHSRDFAKGFVGLMGNVHAIGEAIQITSDESLTWNQIYECIGRALNREVKMVHIASDFIAAAYPSKRGELLGDKSNTVVFDNTKLKRLVPSFCASIRFDQGVQRAAAYMLSHPEVQQPDEAFDQWCDKVIEIYQKALDTLAGA